MKIVLVLVAALLLIGIVVVTAIGDRDQLVQEREAIDSQWTQVEVVLQRRTELVANLMDTVKGHVKPALIKEVDDARAALGGARAPQEKIQANGRLDTPLSRLLLVVDNDPRLKSNENFVHLKDSLDEAENRIAQERRKYNEAIQRYNTDIELFPKNIAAALFGFQRNDAYFKTEPGARVVPHKAF